MSWRRRRADPARGAPGGGAGAAPGAGPGARPTSGPVETHAEGSAEGPGEQPGPPPRGDSSQPAPACPHRGTTRRGVLGGGLAGFGLGAGAALLASSAAGARPGAGNAAEARIDAQGANGSERVPFYGGHQAGVETPPPAHAQFVALTLRDGVDAAGAIRLLRLLSDDAAALTQGEGPLADTEPELALRPARLTVTFGFGRGLVSLAGRRAVPPWLGPLPHYPIDRLEARLCAGDLLLQVCADDAQAVSHAVRMLLKDARSFTRIAWTQAAQRRAYGSDPAGTTLRNPFGQVDGTANPAPGTEDFARLVWGETAGSDVPDNTARGLPPLGLAAGNPAWLRGGTALVLRDIAMNMATWDRADRPAREFSVGRTLDTGAPLTGRTERDEPDFAATDARGLTVIPAACHMARARLDGKEQAPAEQQIYRRVYAYQEVVTGGVHVPRSTGPAAREDAAAEEAEFDRTGLMFASFQADIERQFQPIQHRLAQVDLLNGWTTPIGSTVWAIPPGARGPGDYVGSSLFG